MLLAPAPATSTTTSCSCMNSIGIKQITRGQKPLAYYKGFTSVVEGIERASSPIESTAVAEKSKVWHQKEKYDG